jgi:hypothetical protein
MQIRLPHEYCLTLHSEIIDNMREYSPEIEIKVMRLANPGNNGDKCSQRGDPRNVHHRAQVA